MNIKQNWQHSNISFHWGRTKIWVLTQESAPTTKELTPLYAEEIHMLEGLEDEEVDQYLEENPWLVPLCLTSFNTSLQPMSVAKVIVHMPTTFVTSWLAILTLPKSPPTYGENIFRYGVMWYVAPESIIQSVY